MTRIEGVLSGIIVLAHQDDEIFLLNFKSPEEISHVIYLTDGVRENASYSPEARSEEVIKAWEIINPSVKIVHFGMVNHIRDGKIHVDLSKNLLHNLESFVKSLKPSFILTTLNDGSHQDHDSAFFVSRMVQPQNCELIAFPSYRANYLIKNFFRVMKLPPESLNASTYTQGGNIRFLFLAVNLMRVYSTQKITWLGLGLGVFTRMCLGSQSLSFESNSSIITPRHFFYEKRGRETVSQVQIARLKNSWTSYQ